MPPTEFLRDGYAELARHVVAGDIVAAFEQLPLDRVAEAVRQATSPNTKLVLVP
ncbi:hypothetical protein OG563_46925 [Nocardia vinacea]|uniref:Zinc-binding dehydrogenase n=1 Tax=Nocardia vinacea TaxID=96468 RepID=A0ABZ1YTJ4_9NOCA|nr:hypothetical protein [Nocardia vinacea]